MDLENKLIKHFEEDRVSFRKIEDKFLEQQNVHLKFDEKLNTILIHIHKSNEFMENMAGINDVVKGTKLLKTPSLWLIAFVVGIIALTGGFRTIINWFVIK